MNLKLTVTTVENNAAHTRTAPLAFAGDTAGEEMHVLNLYPQVRYQTFDGFGGAMTEAAAWTYAQMSPENRQKILDACFGEGGLGYSWGRISVDSCDFSLGHYEAMSNPADTELASFTLAADERYVIPFLRAAEETAGRPLHLLLSPWSPPAFMKSTGERNHGGFLKPEYYDFWAKYLCRYIQEYRRRGFTVDLLSVQNEPKATQIWDSCVYTAGQEKTFLRDALAPALRANGLEDVGVCIWDHNKERVFERACDVIDADTDALVQGVAFHWYSGDHFEAVRMTGERFPDKKLIFSEGCVEYSNFDAGDTLGHAQMYAHDIIGNLNAGMQLFLDWNILLDERGGPNHVGNFCSAPIMCHTGEDRVILNPSYDFIGHFSRNIQPGAVRIGCSTYTDRLEATAFENPNGSFAAVLLNRTEQELPVNLRLCGKLSGFTLPANSIASLNIGNR